MNILILRFQSTAGATFRFLEVATSGFLKGTWTLCRPNVRTTAKPATIEYVSQPVTEQLIDESELPHTIIRESQFTDLVAECLPAAVAQGMLRAPAGHAGASFNWREDCAYSAVALPANSQREKNMTITTGPELVSYEDIVSELSEVIGRDIPYVEEFAEEAKQRLFGSSAESQRFSVELSVATAIARGAFELLTSSFEELTGRPPRTVREYLETHKGFLLDA